MKDFLTDSAEYDVATDSFVLKDYIPKDEEAGKTQGHAFCNGAAQMADGTILVAGGDQFWWTNFQGKNVTSDGRRDVRIYTPGQNMVKVAELAYDKAADKTHSGRWYPSAVTLPDENVLIIGGHTVYYNATDPLANNPTYEIFDSKTKTMKPPVKVSMLEETFPINMYPITYVLPESGKLWSLAGNKSVIIDPATGQQTPSAALPEDGILPRSFPFAGTNFMLPLTPKNNYKATVWVCGGVNGTTGARDGPNWFNNCPTCLGTARCYHLDPETPNAQWIQEDMPIPRSQPIAVNLPDGKIAIVGGTGKGHQGGNAGTPYNFDPVTKAVILDPSKPVGDASRWTIAAEASIPRQYHGAALLRPDGTILTSGDDEANYADIPNKDPYELRLEQFSPPYKSISPLPSLKLDQIPQQITYNQLFIIPFTSPVAQQISHVNLIRYSTVTHTMNIDQRHVELEIVKYAKDKLLVKAPPNANVAVPGNWMVFAVDNRGAVVDKAATVNLRASNQGGDASWDEKETVQPDERTVADQAGQRSNGVGKLSMGVGALVAVLGAVGALMV